MQKRQICENLSFVSMGFTLLNSLCPLEKYSLVSYFSFYRLAIPAFLLSMVPVTVDCGNELTCFWKLRSTRSCQGLSSPVAHSQQELCQWFQVNCFPWGWLLPTCTVALRTHMIILTAHMSSTGLLKCQVGFTRLRGGIRGTGLSSKIKCQSMDQRHKPQVSGAISDVLAVSWDCLWNTGLHGLFVPTSPGQLSDAPLHLKGYETPVLTQLNHAVDLH